MTRIVLVRHAETVWHAENRYAGLSDIALTPRGYEQAARLAGWAADAGLGAIWCSPLLRARETAAAAGRAAALEPWIDARLCELDYGRGEGLTRAQMRERFPGALDAFYADPVAHHLPDGEDPRCALRRALAALDALACEHPAGRVLVVTHSSLIRLVLCHYLGVPLSRYRRLFPLAHHVAITEVRLDGAHASLLQFNAMLASATAATGCLAKRAPHGAFRR